MPVLDEVQHDSPLGRWRLVRWSPERRLASYVTALWDLESDEAYTRERIPPRTHFDLLINLGEPHRLLGTHPVEYRRAWIAGFQHQFLDIESPRSSRLMGAQLTAAGARGVVRAPLIEIAGRVVELEEILGGEVARLRERLLEGASAVDRLALFERWIAGRIAGVTLEPPVVMRAALGIVESSGMCRIGDLARDANVSHKHLIALFERNLGAGPKPFARVVRFNALLEYLKRRPTVEWTDVAYRFGYYDQTHFARELRRFTGASPTEFLRSRGPEGDTVVVSGDAPRC